MRPCRCDDHAISNEWWKLTAKRAYVIAMYGQQVRIEPVRCFDDIHIKCINIMEDKRENVAIAILSKGRCSATLLVHLSRVRKTRPKSQSLLI